MNKKLRIVCLLLAAFMVLGLFAGCTSDEPVEVPESESPAESEESAEPASPEEPSETPDEPEEAEVTDWKSFKLDVSKIPQEKLDTTLHVGASIRGLDNPYIVTIIEGMKMFCDFLDSIGQKYEMQTLDSGGSNDREVDNMRQFAAKGEGNAIAYSDPNESAIAPALVEAMAESGGYIGTAWNKPDDVGPEDYTPNWVIHTSPDNVVSGELIAQTMFEAMGGEGKIFVLEGMLGNTAAIDRAKGLELALEKNPGIEVVARDTANWDTNQALNLVETWLNQYPDVKGIWCANDNMATGAIQALDQAGLKGKVYVVGVDATTDMINFIKEGAAIATVSSNGYLQGGYTLAICYAAWTGLLDPAKLPSEYREFATPSMLITTENVEDYIRDYVESAPEFDFTEIFWCKAD